MSNDNILRRILTDYRQVAVVGLSVDVSRPNNGVARYLIQQDFDVIPVNPKYEEVLGRRCYPDLATVPTRVEIVNLFQRSERGTVHRCGHRHRRQGYMDATRHPA